MKNETKELIANMKKTDVYSALLFALYKMTSIKEYSTLCELPYILDIDNLLNLLEYYGGMTITIPTKGELKIMIDALLLYDYVNVDGLSIEEAEKLLEIDNDVSIDEIVNAYFTVAKVLENYNFKRD